MSESEPAPTIARRSIVSRLPDSAALIIFLIAESVYFALRSQYFLGWDNWLNIFTAVAVIGVVAAPGTMLMSAGQIDLSVGSVTAFTSVIIAYFTVNHGLGLSLTIAVLAAIGVGVLNGFLVTVLEVNALITTLGTLAAFRGLSNVIANGQTVPVNNFSWIGTDRPFFNIPVPVILLLLVMAFVWAVMRYTVYGRSMYAIGSNPSAARLVGVLSKRFIFFGFILSAAACALSGIILTSQLGVGSGLFGVGMELSVVTAIVLGGASLSGGRGSIVGTLVGLVIIGILNNGLTLTGVNPFWQDVARGTLLIAAVSFDRLRARLSGK
ncbi:MAG: ribose transport system permease protein [Gaiellales bacterium]|jgi:ribose transport system permease protein|nr:ribose transport system permease protein [Gaiellales bacterium]